MKRPYTENEIEIMLKNSTEETVIDNEFITDKFGNKHNVDEITELAEQDIINKNCIRVNFRWSEFEIKRAKKIAEKLGMPYQTYLKSTLKQAMDRDEKRLFKN